MSETTRLDRLTDEAALARALEAHGLGPEEAGAKAARLVRAARRLIDAGHPPHAPARAWFVPGRIEVLGKHTDYAGGRSLVAATERGFVLAAVERDAPLVDVAALDAGEEVEFPLCGVLEPPVGHWSNYPMTVARRLARNFSGPLRGAAMAVSGDLPQAAGMSSSSALVTACALALVAVNRLDERPEFRAAVTGPTTLAEYLGCIENGSACGPLAGDSGVGTFGGSEDHTAMLCARPGRLGQFSYRPVRLERHVAMPDGYVFAVATSGVAARKTGEARAAYNRASLLAGDVAAVWRRATQRDDATIAAALESGAAEDAVARIRAALAAAPAGEFTARERADRFDHFVAESGDIVPKAGDALERGDLAAFGRLVDESQRLAETLLGNQVPQTARLARTAREAGAVAASSFGAGFGGSVWAMVRRSDVGDLLDRWARLYSDAFPEDAARATFFFTRPAPPAFEV
jgi:galactokinase